ncbi:DUF559 domain-containing protein [Kineococcus gynurae]|uniref:DUF559 domain-containing protein n=1 Tax=Kineococcus gynurae TaxID=452979 RepID=A0ABV5LS36_9ACTN
MEAVEAVTVCGGAARWSRLVALASAWQVRRAVQAGELTRPQPGLLALPGCGPEVLAGTAVAGVLSCHSAAAAWELDLIDPPGRVHVTAPRGSRRDWPSATVHRRARGGLDGRTTVLDTVLDCFRCLPRRTALVPADSALRTGALTVDELRSAADALNRRDPARGLAPLVDPGSGSALESVARLDLLDAGYPVRTQQVQQPAGRVDLLLGGWLVVEVDGYAFHAGPAQFAEDRRRDAELLAGGFSVLRFTFDQVLRQRDWYLGRIASMWERGARGSVRPCRTSW